MTQVAKMIYREINTNALSEKKKKKKKSRQSYLF